MAVYQGDFGKGIATGNGLTAAPGFNPCLLDGPVTIPGVQDQGGFFPKAKIGQVINGDFGTEFVYGKLVLATATDLIPGQVYQLDERFTATLLSTTNANNLLNYEVGVLNVLAAQLAAGTYYGWFARAGRMAIKADGSSIATGQGEASTATAGNLKFLNAHSAGVKTVSPTTAFGASSSITFTGSTTSGSPYINNVVSAGAFGPIEDLNVGMTITGAGLPTNALIWAIDKQGSLWRVTIGTAVTGSLNTLQNATATATGVTFTVTSHVAANVYWPTLAAQN